MLANDEQRQLAARQHGEALREIAVEIRIGWIGKAPRDFPSCRKPANRDEHRQMWHQQTRSNPHTPRDVHRDLVTDIVGPRGQSAAGVEFFQLIDKI
ncbi:hypothetical protein [Rhizobium sp.]|uniref:hypothetical protein n=1 Tax=Rhizobium sp. TaxID=391 RepID=UPI002EF8D1CD